MLYLCKLQENRCLYLVCYLKGNLLPPPWPFKDNDGGCLSCRVYNNGIVWENFKLKINACGFCCLAIEAITKLYSSEQKVRIKLDATCVPNLDTCM